MPKEAFLRSVVASIFPKILEVAINTLESEMVVAEFIKIKFLFWDFLFGKKCIIMASDAVLISFYSTDMSNVNRM